VFETNPRSNSCSNLPQNLLTFVFLYYNFLKYVQIFSQEISIWPGETNAPIVQGDRPIIQANGPTVLDVHLRPISLKHVEENGK
jgi:hypothetical protein